jgi:DNA-binding NtrC family response regulator
MNNDRKSILIIEDDTAQQEFYRMVLEREGYIVMIFGSIREAIPSLESCVCDLYIIDAILKDGEDGTSLIETSYRPMLIISGLEFEELESVRSLQKPITAGLLKDVIRDMIYEK